MRGLKSLRSHALGLVALILLLAWTLPALAGGDPLSPAQRQWVKKHAPIKVGVFKDYPPFGFVDEQGKVQGISIDFWRLLSQKVYVPVSFECADFNGQLQGLKSGRFDSLAGIFYLPSRAKHFDFTKAYYIINTYIWVGPGQPVPQGWAGLEYLTVGVVKGDSGQVLAEQHGLKPRLYRDYPAVVDALARGEVEAMVMDQLVAAYFLRKRNLQGMVRHTKAPVDSGRMSLAVAKGNRMLMDILKKGVALISQEEIRDIELRWLGD
ncbi:MAG: transporter substrate-binding domain-containing protein [Desulfarculaceae bacterium]|nr:transporter substrate-binding domain-containing protein [Desulfarculaceae bacterium]MCF8071380.1 transporter substrate-binding domain-containing protein [Desulfarculaceae bacterium]MCF8101705.1 transporter substrate-binding domain-containing protein [Desulfarculaceae bacterium]MCF8116686.1 transporter substrate-binding domain-containing protein [Desulfarculaceae bacterium]